MRSHKTVLIVRDRGAKISPLNMAQRLHVSRWHVSDDTLTFVEIELDFPRGNAHPVAEQIHGHPSPAGRRSAPESGRATPSAQLTNPFSSNSPIYVADSSGRPCTSCLISTFDHVLTMRVEYLGTSSNWAFNRRVLSMAYERLTGQPVPVQNTMFGGTMYDLGWNGQRDIVASDTTPLPSADYAIYLINAVKFHCGQMFHLFDEISFMWRFHDFHATTTDISRPNDLWYVHFLIILAFGKVFAARRNNARRPPGAELFVQAMKLKPDVTCLHTQPLHAVEILCCEALYVQYLDFRSAAYNVIGQAPRIALAEGMHTNMQDQGLDETHVQRCRNLWWTVYILDRQMSSLMGVPLAVRDEDITASLPSSRFCAQDPRIRAECQIVTHHLAHPEQ